MNFLKKLFVSIAGIIFIYYLGRLYFAVTGGFTINNISAQLPFDPQWEIEHLAQNNSELIHAALNQKYFYLGKGCQSYVFVSQDGNYVIKFVKFQRFRPQSWLRWLNHLPSLQQLYAKKEAAKKAKLHKLFTSWKLAYEQLPKETAVLFVHLNETPKWQQTLKITDKAGFEYCLQLGSMHFLLQRKAEMLPATIERYMLQAQSKEAENLIDKLLSMLLSEYRRGLADNDHALMQNTGVLHGDPIHIDAGQFIYNPLVQQESLFKKEIYDKTFNFFKWLQKSYPPLAEHLKYRLVSLLGVDYFSMQPYVHKGDVNKIPHCPSQYHYE